VQGNQVTLKQHVSTCLKGKKAIILDQQGSLKDRVEVRTKAIEQFKKVVSRGKRRGCHQDRLYIKTTSIEINDKFPPHS